MVSAQQRTEAHHSLLSRLEDARAQTDRLFAIVKPGSLYERPIPERHRIIFYLGHLEAFDWNLLRDRLAGLSSFNKHFDNLFAFGIDPVDGGLPSDQPGDWPSNTEVVRYNHRLREALDGALKAGRPLASGATGFDAGFSMDVLLNVAIEHRLMHAETLAYMLHQLPYEQKVAQSQAEAAMSSGDSRGTVEIPSGAATLGASHSSSTFGWDNEYDRHEVEVPSFEIDACKVTNREFLQFMAEGGYENPEFWTKADWKWKTESNISHPVFWRRAGDVWHYRGIFEEFPLPLDWPVYVSHAEATAYARWAGKKLPTEEQWHRAALGTPDSSERSHSWGNLRPDSQPDGNFDFHRWDPVPVNAYPMNQSAFGVRGCIGNGWEWTSSVFKPFPGFQPFPFYPGYSANFFDDEHYVLKGGSARTARCMLRQSFRNWFQPHYQYVYAAFRCVNG